MRLEESAPAGLKALQRAGLFAWAVSALMFVALLAGLAPAERMLPPLIYLMAFSIACRGAALLLFPEELLADERRREALSLDGGRYRENLRFAYPFFFRPAVRRLQGAIQLCFAGSAILVALTQGGRA